MDAESVLELDNILPLEDKITGGPGGTGKKQTMTKIRNHSTFNILASYIQPVVQIIWTGNNADTL